MSTTMTTVNRLITRQDVEKLLNFAGNIGDHGEPLKPRDLSRYQTAFVHKSLHRDEQLGFHPKENNERLEFLGDSFVGAVTAEYLMERFPNEQEGFLTKLRTRLVRASTLYRFARYLGLGKFILLSPQTEQLTLLGPNKGRANPKFYEDTFEAFVGAMVQDFGGAEAYRYVQRFLVNIIEHNIDFAELILSNENHKDTLQRYFQSLKWPNPVYDDLDEHGPSHTKTFTKGVFIRRDQAAELSQDQRKDMEEHHDHTLKTVPAHVAKRISDIAADRDSLLIGLGTGNKKNVAEQACSRNALLLLKIDLNW